MWFLGDEFAVKSFQQYFKSKEHSEFPGYCMENFNVTGYVSDDYSSNNLNIISHLQNGLALAIKQEILLPKIITVVPDDNLISFMEGTNQESGLTKPLGRIIDAVMREYNNLINIQKEFLLKKAKKADYPKIVWIEPPLHANFNNNTERRKMIRAMNDVVKFHDNNFMLWLKKVWDAENLNLFSKKYNCFTNEGYTTYWRAVDTTLKFADTILFKKKKDWKPQGPHIQAGKHHQDIYHWRRQDDVKFQSDCNIHGEVHSQRDINEWTNHGGRRNGKIRSQVLLPPPPRRRQFSRSRSRGSDMAQLACTN